MKRLFKKGDKVNVSGDLSSKDYNVRVSSPAVVDEDQKTSRSNVWVTIAEVDGDHNVSLYIKPRMLSLVKEELPRIESDDTTRVWVNEEAGLVVTDFLGSGDNLDDDDIKQGFHAYSMNSVYRSEERRVGKECEHTCRSRWSPDRKSTRLNSSHRLLSRMPSSA